MKNYKKMQVTEKRKKKERKHSIEEQVLSGAKFLAAITLDGIGTQEVLEKDLVINKFKVQSFRSQRNL